jgi:hypothetical protein
MKRMYACKDEKKQMGACEKDRRNKLHLRKEGNYHLRSILSDIHIYIYKDSNFKNFDQ